jgi:rhodanese-related sulfurtransferase
LKQQVLLKNKYNAKSTNLRCTDSEEFTQGHIDDAVNVNWLGDNFVADAKKFDKTKPILYIVKVETEAKKATEKLNELGFKTYTN